MPLFFVYTHYIKPISIKTTKFVFELGIIAWKAKFIEQALQITCIVIFDKYKDRIGASNYTIKLGKTRIVLEKNPRVTICKWMVLGHKLYW